MPTAKRREWEKKEGEERQRNPGENKKVLARESNVSLRRNKNTQVLQGCVKNILRKLFGIRTQNDLSHVCNS